MSHSSDHRQGIDSAVLLRYLSGESNKRERAMVLSWLRADPAHSAELDALNRAWILSTAARSVPGTKAIWQRLSWMMMQPSSAAARAHQLSPTSRFRFSTLLSRHAANMRWIPAAVTLVALLITPLIWWEHAQFVLPRREVTPMREYRTGNGQREVVRLADGSSVIMGPATDLRFPNDPTSGKRLVLLDGEALFDVVHDSMQPFVVRARGADTQDLGTRFVVNAYREDSLVRVVVVEGTVAVVSKSMRRSSASTVLVRGDVATIAPGGRLRTEHDRDLAAYTSWSTGYLTFDNTRLGDALPQLARWYDLEFRLSDAALADRRLNATLHDEPLSEVLKLLSLSLSLRIERTGNVFVMSSRRAPAPRH